jgi:hypothetical protein
MAGRLELELAGARHLADTTRAAVDRVEQLNAVEGDRAGTIILAAVKPPILTGALAATVHVVTTAEGFGVAAGGPGAPYAAIVHARTPFITTAFLAREDAVVATYAEGLEAAVDSIGGD